MISGMMPVICLRPPTRGIDASQLPIAGCSETENPKRLLPVLGRGVLSDSCHRRRLRILTRGISVWCEFPSFPTTVTRRFPARGLLSSQLALTDRRTRRRVYRLQHPLAYSKPYKPAMIENRLWSCPWIRPCGSCFVQLCASLRVPHSTPVL